MTNIIKVLPNQSMLDIVLQSCGTLDAAMQMMMTNEMSISDYPLVGNTLLTDNDKIPIAKDKDVLHYLSQNGIVIGTLGANIALGFRVLLKPVMQAVPVTATLPSITGDYEFDFSAAPGFVNFYTIPHALYPDNNNILWYSNKVRYLAHDAPYANLCTGSYMNDRLLHYYLLWEASHGFTLAWIDLGAINKTATFIDEMGNQAYSAPLIVFDSDTQSVVDYLLADLSIELVSATTGFATLRLTRSHTPATLTDFSDHTMIWLNDAAGGTPDPLDPSNPDKTILVLPAGRYTFGVGTTYTDGPITYPPSAFTEVIEIL